MKAFIIAIILTVLFVAGSVFALQPSPRQRQLAKLRHRAVMGGLRVRIRPGEHQVEYTLPWRITDIDRPQAPDFVATREGPEWRLELRHGPAAAVLQPLLERLPDAVNRVVAGAEGVIATWPEDGSESDVARIADVLFRVRAECGAAQPAT